MPGSRAQGGLPFVSVCSRTCEGTSRHSSEKLEQTFRPLDDPPVMISGSLQRCYA